jgi:hypothetical protein
MIDKTQHGKLTIEQQEFNPTKNRSKIQLLLLGGGGKQFTTSSLSTQQYKTKY